MEICDQKRLVVGILAPVDAGKTTLTEALLVAAGARRTAGRVDHGDAFLDTAELEKARGITIFSKPAILRAGKTELTLVDTPGHADLSAETERALAVLDYAVLVVSGTDGVQAHTETLWRLLARRGVPVFFFVNKMDLPGPGRAALLAALRGAFGEGVVDFGAPEAARGEAIAMADETLMAEYLRAGAVSDGAAADAAARRALFPCWFGAALRGEGADALLAGLDRYTRAPAAGAEFAAQVYKIGADDAGARLSWMKITGGSLKAKALLAGRDEAGRPWSEKADQVRLYSGAKFTPAGEALPGMVAAVTGLTRTYAGEGLGAAPDAAAPRLAPLFSAQVLLPEGADAHAALGILRRLAEEDPALHVRWNEALGQIHLQLMGEVQREVLQSVLKSRFGLAASFGPTDILYKETLTAPVEGVGHYEPLRHYAEVHLLLEPLPAGSGLRFGSDCRTDALDGIWQRQILSQLGEKEHLGVLTGAPLTDVKITLLAGRAHPKHTEGGDFREAACRAVRQGLETARAAGQMQLLEPWLSFRLEVPADCVGRAMADLQRMAASFAPPAPAGALTVLTGSVPAAACRDYARELAGYTRGRGRFSAALQGYAPCHDAPAVIAAAGYESERDLDNPADSIFCAHGAGYLVKWSEVPACAHVQTGWGRPAAAPAPEAVSPRRVAAYCGTLAEDRELLAIFEQTYGPIRRDVRRAFRPAEPPAAPAAPAAPVPAGPEYLLVDGYNVLYAWDDLRALAAENLDAARRRLADILCNYRGYRACEVILVFDAYRVPGGTGSVAPYHNISVVYTKEAETADTYIERVTHTLSREHRVRVVTSDGAEQMIILGNGALRVPARIFREEVDAVEAAIRACLTAGGKGSAS